MSEREEDGCVDRDLRWHGLAGLYVLSGSVFPGSSSANPTLTIAALALRLGDRLGAGTPSGL
jgi:choline dehydrogenase-like flavoprotein